MPEPSKREQTDVGTQREQAPEADAANAEIQDLPLNSTDADDVRGGLAKWEDHYEQG